MKKTKRILAMLLVVVMALSVMPLTAFAADSVSLTGEYYDVDDTGAVTGTGKTNPVQTVTDAGSDASVTYSKTAAATSNDNEFEITLNVETMQDLAEIETTGPASVVLVFNVDDSMDCTIDNLPPAHPTWDISDSRWTAVKKAAEKFIDGFLADPNSGNEVSIVVYGGNQYAVRDMKISEYTGSATPWRLICDWTSNATAAKATFNYEVVAESTIITAAGLTDASSLRKAVFGDTNNYYGLSSNAQVGFIGATTQLGSYNPGNAPYVVFMSTGEADDCESIHIGGYRDLTVSVPAAIAEAGNLKSMYSACTLYTVGFGSVAQTSKVLLESADGGLDGNNPYVDEYFSADDGDELEILYETILSQIYTASQAWTVTDPMPDYVTVDSDFIDSLPDYCTWDSASNTLVWDLTKCTPTESTDGSGKTIYTYTLTYTVTVDPTDLTAGTYYPTNLKTTLDYAFADTTTEELGETQTANFLVPTVKLDETPTTTYTVTYDANGGTGSHADANLAEDSEYTVKSLKATGISYEGYTFKGWTTEADGSGTKYDPGDTITIEADVTLYAQWEKIPTPAAAYKVTYNPNGGVGTAYSVTEEVGDEHTVLANTNNNLGFTKAGYAFLGWSTDPLAISADYEADDTIGADASDGEEIILYAVWAEIQSVIDYYVIYYSNGGTGNPYEDNGLAEDSIYTVKNLTTTGIARADYTFLGWSTTASGAVAYGAGDTITITDNVQLYAQWEKIPDPDPTYTVTYDPNGGTGGSSDSGLLYDSDYTVKNQAGADVSRPGYTFTGWNTENDGSGLDYDAGDTLTIQGNVTLYAQWEENPENPDAYSAEYTFVSGTSGKSLPKAVWALLPNDNTDYEDGDTAYVIAPVQTTVYVTGGTWTFSGWDESSKEIDGSDVLFTGTWTFEVTVPDGSTYNVGYTFVSDSGKSIPQAVWDQLPSDTNDYDDGDAAYAIAPDETTVYVTGGTWTFVGWDADSKEIDGDDVVFTGTWTYTAGEPEVSTYNAGYTFVSDSGKSIPQTVWDQLPNDTTDYADGDTVNAITPAKTTVKVTGGTWTFTAWDANSKTIDGDDVLFTGTWTYTADEAEPSTYNAGYTFVSDSGKSIPKAVWDQLPSDTTNYANGTIVNAITPAKTTVKVTGGTWTFTAWDANSKTIDSSDVLFTGTWTYTADEATSPTYTVDYDANGGKGSHTDTGLTSGSEYNVRTLPATGITRDGYTFKGWNTKADGSGTSYAPGDTITITEDLTLYAQWEKTSSGDTTGNTTGNTTNNTTSKTTGSSGTTSSPKTGDSSNMTLWITLLFVSLAGTVCLLWAARRKKQHNKER